MGAFGAKVAVVGRNAERGKTRVNRIDQNVAARQDSLPPMDSTPIRWTRPARRSNHGPGGPASVLVNAAGGNRPEATIPPGGDVCKLPLDAWRDVFDLNLVGGALLPSQVFGQDMIDAGVGSVINIASMSGIIPLSRVVAYSAAKAAVINLTMWLAREWATTGVRVNAISPGFFPAEQNRKLLLTTTAATPSAAARSSDTRRWVGSANRKSWPAWLIWLASRHASSFVTGQNICVDGGFASVTI